MKQFPLICYFVDKETMGMLFKGHYKVAFLHKEQIYKETVSLRRNVQLKNRYTEVVYLITHSSFMPDIVNASME